ncbi:hypothetical protein A7982_13102 [Minicystis rosea]|nr:hypothetical protein A7982_13102 [Minicystis rosea]
MRALSLIAFHALALLAGCTSARVPNVPVSGDTIAVCPVNYPVPIELHSKTPVPAPARVVLAGLAIGEVVSQGAAKHVTVCLRSGLDLFSNATLSRHTSSMLGEVYLELAPGSPETIAPGGARVPGAKLPPGGALTLVE